MTEIRNLPEDYTVNPDELDTELPEPGTVLPVQLIIPEEYGAMRLDQALARLLPEYSRSRLQSWIEAGLVSINGKATTSIKQKIWEGERVALTPQRDPADMPYSAEDIPLEIVHEDDAILIINKPVGLVVHPGSGNWSGTLLNALLHHAPQLAEVPRAGIVHRLDKDTSGLLVVAKTLVAQTDLVRQLQARSVSREYLALVYGEVTRNGTVEAPIDRHPTQRTKMAVVAGGKTAITHYAVQEAFPGCTLLRCKLETGRTHQIRVHMASIQHPLVGDRLYLRGAQKCATYLREMLGSFPRQALHAERLGLQHPQSGEWMSWQVEMPQDMQQLLADVRIKVSYNQGIEN